jgi:SAM-dependent methyltransferase
MDQPRPGAGLPGHRRRHPHRTEGERELLGLLPERCDRVLDLGTGDGRLVDLVRTARPEVRATALDVSPTMPDAFRERFAEVPADEIELVSHDLAEPLPQAVVEAGPFDAVVSSFAIHHTTHERKAKIDREVFAALRPGGLFANLEHVASPTERLHQAFYAAMTVEREARDPDNTLAPVEDQLTWRREAGFVDVDCLWKWREMALLAGWKSAT